MTRDSLFEKHVNIVNKMAWSFSRTTGQNFEELKSEGVEALLRAIDNFDESKGNKLCTVVTTYSLTAMRVFVKKQFKHSPVMFKEEISRFYDHTVISSDKVDHAPSANNYFATSKQAVQSQAVQSQAKRYEFMNELESLGGEAKTIASILLNSPAEVLGIALDSSACSIRVAIKKHMKELGFTNKSILLGISEIKALVS